MAFLTYDEVKARLQNYISKPGRLVHARDSLMGWFNSGGLMDRGFDGGGFTDGWFGG